MTIKRQAAYAGRLGVAVGLICAVGMFIPASNAQTSNTAAAFSGSAAAGGVRVTINIPGAPGTDTPVDGGGPTAQVAVDTIGTSTGYAAFPDPGQFVVSVPGLAVGLLAGGAGGLPPIKLPSPPNYPFFVTSDASNAPEQSAGSGPYEISASSQSNSSAARASAGLATGAAGNAALSSSTASLSPSSTGGVVAKAVSDLQGLTVGPLTIGEITSTAIETMDSSGTITPSTNLSIAGLRIGGVPAELTPKGFVAGGTTYPVPLNATLASLLKSSGITMQFVSPQQFPGRVIAPALQVTYPFAMPFSVPNVGKHSGTATIIIGSATAQMSGAAGAESGLGATAAATPGAAESASGGSSASDVGSAAASSEPSAALGAATQASSSPAQPSVALATPAAAPRANPAQVRVAESLDVRSVYLMVLAGALVALGLGQLIRRLGGRAWISMGG